MECLLEKRVVFCLFNLVAFEIVVNEFVLQFALVYLYYFFAVGFRQTDDLSFFFFCHDYYLMTSNFNLFFLTNSPKSCRSP